MGLRRWLFPRSRRYDELSAMIREHLDEKVSDLMESGMSREEAEHAARREFGNTTLVEERSREVWMWPRVESIVADLKYALRQLRQSPGFVTTVIATMALGIGVNTAIFTVFDQVLLQTMPVHRAERLVLLEESSAYETGNLNAYTGSQSITFSYSAYQALSKNTVLENLAVSALAPVTIKSPAMAENTWLQMVSGNYFDVMDLRPVLGRLLTSSDDRLHAANPVAVMSEAYWRAKFGSDPSILNRVLLLNGSPVTIVGIVRNRGIVDANPVALFIPVALQGKVEPVFRDPFPDPLNCWLNLVGRLDPGVTRVQAETQLNGLWWNWRRDTLHLRKDKIPDGTGWLQTRLTVSSGAKGISTLEENFSKPVVLLQAMALIVLLIVCGNIANILLARAARKQSELAMRAALGAQRTRIFQQVVVEGLLLGAMGAAAGILLGTITLRLLLHFTPDSDILHVAVTSHLGWQIIAAAIVVGLLTSVLFSLAPAVLSTRIDLLRSLHGQTGAVAAGSSQLRLGLIAAQIALSLGLLTCATIFSCNLYLLHSIDPGFTTTHVLTFTVDAAQQGDTLSQANQKYAAITAGLNRLPGVRNVVYARNGLITGNLSGGNVTVTGHANSFHDPSPFSDMVSPGFFSAMQVPMIAGREFTQTDTEPGHKAAIVDQSFVKRFFNGDIQKALAASLTFGNGAPDTPIVGVVPTVRYTDLTQDPGSPFIYLAWELAPHIGTHVQQYPAVFYIRTAADPGTLASSVQTVVHEIDRGLPIDHFETMQDHLYGLTFDSQLVTILSTAMGALALLLAAIGLYGVLAFSVAQRTREIGVRIALGAARGAIIRLIARQVAWTVMTGIFVGALLGVLGTKILMSHDVGLTIHLAQIPVGIFCISGIVLLLAMAVAALLPAHRAASVDPIEALRAE
jgi:putative ABC transport system permease protein